MTIKNKTESLRVAQQINAVEKKCFYNAFRTLTELAEYSDAIYVEGIAIAPSGLIIEHGWVEQDDQIVDPTIPDADTVYFAGLRFQGVAGVRRAMESIPKSGKEDLPIFYRYGWSGGDSPEMNQARKLAMAYSQSLSENRNNPQ